MSATVDRDEYGEPVSDRYQRLGANGNQEGMYVRFEPGFGLNVIIGHRLRVTKPGGYIHSGPYEYRDFEKATLGIDGWERLGEFVDEWRERERGDDR